MDRFYSDLLSLTAKTLNERQTIFIKGLCPQTFPLT